VNEIFLPWIGLKRRFATGSQCRAQQGEARNERARAIFFYRLGEMRHQSLESQVYRVSDLKLLICRDHSVEETHLLNFNSRRQCYTDYCRARGTAWMEAYLTGDYVWTDAEQSFDGVLRPLTRREINARSLGNPVLLARTGN
jgi:hypothetical protein